MDAFVGLVQLGDTIIASFITRNGSDVPTEASSLPTYRIYGESDDLITSGSAALKDSGSVTGATNASPIVITSASHGLTNGTRVTLSAVGGNTAANSTYLVANKTTNTFELEGSTGNGAYTSGGTWRVTGLYSVSIAATSGNGFESGKSYAVLVTYTVSATTYSQLMHFQVV